MTDELVTFAITFTENLEQFSEQDYKFKSINYAIMSINLAFKHIKVITCQKKKKQQQHCYDIRLFNQIFFQ